MKTLFLTYLILKTFKGYSQKLEFEIEFYKNGCCSEVLNFFIFDNNFNAQKLILWETELLSLILFKLKRQAF